ncbi:GNAT family N-acetyltransferase [Kibdelosporangium aridum]|uniref:GNAT family N-acetyltransferase n=1 Tax=Kibdelosporangium aridum TaxID=2030 RepID=UPI0007C5305C
MDVAEIHMLPRAAAIDTALITEVSDLVNLVYATAEAGLWNGGADRTTPAEVARLVAAAEIAVARAAGEIVGCVRVRQVGPDVGEFGLLAAAPRLQGAGVGRGLVRFAEEHCRLLGRHRIQLKLLVPHGRARFPADWFGRLGYRVEKTASVEDTFPHLVPRLAVPCEFHLYRKNSIERNSWFQLSLAEQGIHFA